MKLRQLVLVLFRHQRVEKPNRNSTKTAVALPLARCARVIPRRVPDAIGRLILARGQLRPPLHPPDQERCSVDLTRRASPSGLPTGRCFTLRPPDRCFDSGFDQESLRALHGPPDRGRLRSPPGPSSTRRVPPWTCTRAMRPSTAAGLSRPCPTTNREAGWMRPPGGRPMSGQRGSEKRQRSVIIQSRVAPAERATIQAKADATGVSVSELIRYAVLNYRLPLSRVDRQAVSLLLAELAKNRGEVSKAGTNVNQIAHHLNSGRPGDVMDGRIRSIPRGTRSGHRHLVRTPSRLPSGLGFRARSQAAQGITSPRF